ncbi:TetR/AcrR family transcriptional regulator [Photobacterium ganghwense]|uniref:TetR/AcrR family transcriptional regulator n=1 Tax=Photobacterium ganghwense TaxID=320778 RepID=UPI004055B33D
MSKKDHILNIAEALYNELGYTAVGVDLIRDKAAVSKTSMYRHFGSKNKLIEAVLIRRHQRFEEELQAVTDAQPEPFSKLDALLDWHFSWFHASDFKGCMFMHALAEFKGHDQAIAEHALAHKAWLKTLMQSLVLALNDRNDQEDLTRWVDEHAEILLTFLEGMIVRAEFGDSTSYESSYRKTMNSLLRQSVK